MTKSQYKQFIYDITCHGNDKKSGFTLLPKDYRKVYIAFNHQDYAFDRDKHDVTSICKILGNEFHLKKMIDKHNKYYSNMISKKLCLDNINVDIVLTMLTQYVCDKCGTNSSIGHRNKDPKIWCRQCFYWFHLNCLPATMRKELEDYGTKFIPKCEECSRLCSET